MVVSKMIVERNYVQVIGTIWMPSILAATEYPLSRYDVENIGERTRENVEAWLDTHSGDFASIEDFYVTIAEWESEWSDPESELVYNDCVYGSEE